MLERFLLSDRPFSGIPCAISPERPQCYVFEEDKRTDHCPGEMSTPFLCASCAQPPALASPPCFSAYPFTRSSSSGRKWRTRPCRGQAKASPNATIQEVSRDKKNGGVVPGEGLTANGVAFNLLSQLLKHVDFTSPSLAAFEPLHDLLRPLTPLPTRRALPAALMPVERSEP